MTYTKQTWADSNPSYPVSAARLSHMEDGIAAVTTEAAASASAAASSAASLAALTPGITLVAGTNVTIDQPTGSTVRVSAATTSVGAGDPAAIFTVSRALLGASPTGVVMTSGTLRLAFLTCPVAKSWTKLRTYSTVNSFNTPTIQRMGLYELLPGGTLSLVGSTANDTATLWRTSSLGYSIAMSSPVTTTPGTVYAIGSLVVSGASVASLASVSINSAESLIGDPEAAFSTGYSDLPASITSSNYFATTAKIYAALVA